MAVPRVKRRSLLLGGAAAVAGGSILWVFDDWYRPGTLLSDSAAAVRIGARYADRFPEGADALWRGEPPKTPADWGPRLEQLRGEDFEADRLIEVDGWWLAETELRLCVLLHTTA